MKTHPLALFRYCPRCGSAAFAVHDHRSKRCDDCAQAQRVAIARAMVASPAVVFADEPTGALDQNTGAQVMQLLTQACTSTGATLVLVTHDDAIAAWCPRLVTMRDGNIVADQMRVAK